MFCALSGETPTEPVVSPRSGSIFEKKHIVRYLLSTSADPITDEPLTKDELIELNVPPVIVPPQQSRPQSIPSLLADFQNEWDAVALEMYTLRKQLFQARQELSAALTHHDAAVRVVARVMKERDDARAALLQLAASTGDLSTQEASGSIPIDLIADARDTLFKIHRSQKSKGFAPGHELIVKDTQKMSINRSIFGNSFFDPSTLMLLVCSEGTVVQIYVPTLDIVKDEQYDGCTFAVLLGDSVCVAFTEKFLIDGATYKRNASSKVLQIAPHPLLSRFFATRDSESKFSFYDTNQRDHSCVFESEKLDSLSYIGFHVDGALLAAGLTNQVGIYNVLDGTQVTTIATSCSLIKQIIFALNGYWMIVLSHTEQKSVVDVMDLRINVLVHSIEVDSTTTNIAIDASSTLLFAQSDTKITMRRYTKKTKSWSHEATSIPQECALILLDLTTYTDTESPTVAAISCCTNGDVCVSLLA